MKHLILSILFLFNISLALGQCSPDTSLTGNNIYYAPSGSKFHKVGNKEIIVLPYAQAGQPYSEVIQFKVPTDTNIGGLQANIDYIKIISVQNLSGNIGLSCNPLNCTFSGGSYGCAQLSGTAGNPDSVQVEVSVEYKFETNGNTFTAQDTLRDIYLVVKGSPVSDKLNTSPEFSARFFPNPAKNSGFLIFTDVAENNARVKITNVIGNTVFLKEFTSQTGENKISLNLSQLPAGIYLYSVKSGSHSQSGRFIINR